MKKIVLFILCCFIMGCSSGLTDIMKITKITPTSNPTYCIYEAQSITFTNSKTHSLFYGSCSEYNMNDEIQISNSGTYIVIGFLSFWLFMTSILLMIVSFIRD